MSFGTTFGGVLEKIGRYTKTDVGYLARGNFWLGLSTLVGTASALGVALIFGNLISAETYGTYRFVLSYYSILTIAGLSGFKAATVRAVAMGFEGEVLRSFKFQVLSSLIGTVISAGIGGYYFLNDNAVLGASFVILALVLPFIESLAIYEAFLSGRQAFKALSKYSVIAQLLVTILLIGAILANFEVVKLLITFFAGWIALRLLFFIYVLKKFKPNKKTSPETVKLGTHFTVMGFLNNVASYLDRIALFHYLGAAEVAIYSFAIAPTEQVKGFFKNIDLLALPRFSEREESELKKTMIRKMTIMAAVVLAFVSLYIVFAPPLFKLLLPKYQASIFPSQIFALSLIGVVAILPVSAMKSLSKIRGLYFYNTVLPILNIALILILTPIYGLMGTIFARMIGRLIGIFLAIFALYRL